MSFEITGLKEVQNKLKQLSDKAEKLDGQSVPLTDIMTDSFITKNTQFQSFNEFIEKSGFKIDSQKDFDAIPNDEWNKFIAANTSFPDWQAMINKGGAIYASKKFGL